MAYFGDLLGAPYGLNAQAYQTSANTAQYGDWQQTANASIAFDSLYSGQYGVSDIKLNIYPEGTMLPETPEAWLRGRVKEVCDKAFAA